MLIPDIMAVTDSTAMKPVAIRDVCFDLIFFLFIFGTGYYFSFWYKWPHESWTWIPGVDSRCGFCRSIFKFQRILLNLYWIGNGNIVKLIQLSYHLIDTIFYFVGFLVPLYFILQSRRKKIEGSSLVKLMILLASFMFIQFIYHITGGLNFKLLSKGILEPISAVVLTMFAIIYFISIKKIKREKEEAKI